MSNTKPQLRKKVIALVVNTYLTNEDIESNLAVKLWAGSKQDDFQAAITLDCRNVRVLDSDNIEDTRAFAKNSFEDAEDPESVED